MTLLFAPAKIADASTNNTINFQARLLTASGAVVPDGSYNVEFKIYNALTSSGSSQGSCTGDADCLWTETRTGGNTVTVQGGYMSVQLGSVTAFPTTINWDQPLWLSIRIGGIGTPSWDTEMSPRLPLTAVPYAFRAGTIAESSSSNEATLAFGSISGNDTITLPDASGTVCLQAASACGFATGSGTAFLQGGNSFSAAAVLGTNDNNNLQLETDGSTRLTISNNSSNLTFATAPTISVTSAASASALTIQGQTATGTSNNGGDVDIEGGTPGSGGSYGNVNLSDITNFQVQNASGADILDANTSTSQVNVGSLLATPGTVTAMQAPATPTVTPTGGTSASVSYAYEVTAVSANGAETLASTAGTTATGRTFSLLSSSIYNAVSWSSVTGASFYKVYRTTGGTTLGLVGETSSTSFNDTGLTAGAQPPALESSGGLTASTTYYYEVTALDDTGGQTTPSSQSTSATTSTYKAITLSWAPIAGARAYDVYRTTTSGTYTTDSYYTAYSNNLTDTGATATGTNIVPPTTTTAYANNIDNNATSTVTIGNSGTATGQLYIGGQVPTSYVGSTTAGLNQPYSVFVSGNYAYMASKNNNSLVIYDISSPAKPVEVSSTSSGLVAPQSVYVSGRYAYVASEGSGALVIFDVSNPANPVEVGSSNSGLTNPYSVYVSGRYAYVASEGSGALVIFDVSNPANPVEVGSSNSGLTNPYSVYVSGRYAYVASEGSGALVIFDVSNPANPVKVGSSTNGLSNPYSVYVSGRYAYVADRNNNALVIFDISNPADPLEVATISSGLNQPTSVYVSGRYAYVTNFAGNSLAVFDISNPADPLYVGSTGTTLNEPYSVYVSGRYAYVASYGGSALFVLDLGGAYIQSLQAGSTETGTLQVDTNAQVGGDETVQGSITAGSSLQVAGNATLGGLTINGVATSAAPTVTPTGGSATSYSYAVVAFNTSGSSPASMATTTSTGAATLSATAYNTVTWSSVTGATGYNIYRTASSGTPSTTGYIGTIYTGSTLSFIDNGIAATGTTPTTNTAGSLTADGLSTFEDATNSTTAFQIQNASATDLLNVDTTDDVVSINATGTTGNVGAWTLSTNGLPQNLEQATSVTYNGYAYVMGGINNGGTAVATVYYATLNANGSVGTWTTDTASPLPQNLERATSVFYNSYVYVMGGQGTASTGDCNSSSNCDSVYYAPINANGSVGAWTNNANLLPQVLYNATSVVYNGYVYVMGGDNGSSSVTTVYYAPINANGSVGAWTTDTTSPLPQTFFRATSVTYNGYIYEMGGCASSCPTTAVYYAPINANGSVGAWIADSNSPLPQAVEWPSSVVYNGYVYVMGGWTGSVAVATVYYAPLGANGSVGTWTTDTTNPLSQVLYGATSVAYNGYIYEMGGYTGSGYLGTVYYAPLSTTAVQGNLQLSGSDTIGGNEAVQGSFTANGNIVIQGAGSLGSLLLNGGLTTPGAPTIAAKGTTASATYDYAIQAYNGSGTSTLSANTQITNGQTTLTSINYNNITWSGINGSTGYNIFRTVTGGTSSPYNTTGQIGSITSASLLPATPTGFSMTGTTLTLTFATAPQVTVGQLVYLSGFTSSPTTVNNTTTGWVVTAVTGTTIQLYITSGSTSTESVMGIAYGILGFGDNGLGVTTTTIPTSGTAGTETIQTTSTAALQVQNASGVAILSADTVNNQVLLGTVGSGGANGQLAFNTTTNSDTITINALAATSSSYTLNLPTSTASSNQCLQSGTVSGSTVPLVWGACSSTHSKKVVLTPEYAGAVLSNGGVSNDIGTMTSGYDTSQKENYYEWTTTQSTNQVYDVVVAIPLPSDYGSSPSITVDAKTSSTTNGTITGSLIDTNGTTDWSSYSLTPSSNNTWSTMSGNTITGANNSANGIMILTLVLQAPTSGTTQIGDIVLSYTSAY